MLEAGCEEDGGAGPSSGAGSGQEFSRLVAKRMERLERALELDLVGIFVTGCDEDRMAGVGSEMEQSTHDLEPDLITSRPTLPDQVLSRSRLE